MPSTSFQHMGLSPWGSGDSAFNTSCVERLKALLTLVLIPSVETKLIAPSTRGLVLILALLEVLSVDA